MIKSHILNCGSCMFGVSIKSFKVLKRCRSSFEILIYEVLNIRRLNPTSIKQLFNRGSLFTIKFLNFHFSVTYDTPQYDERVI